MARDLQHDPEVLPDHDVLLPCILTGVSKSAQMPSTRLLSRCRPTIWFLKFHCVDLARLNDLLHSGLKVDKFRPFVSGTSGNRTFGRFDLVSPSGQESCLFYRPNTVATHPPRETGTYRICYLSSLHSGDRLLCKEGRYKGGEVLSQNSRPG